MSSGGDMLKKTAIDEIAFSMSEMLKNAETKESTPGEKVLEALAHLNSAAELLDSIGFEKSAEAITNIMVQSASELQPKENHSILERLEKLERGK